MRGFRLVAPRVVLLLACGLASTGCDSDTVRSDPESARSSTTTSGTASQPPGNEPKRVKLTVGHCYIEPIRVAGKTWITKQRVMGGGGGLPRHFTDKGTFTILGPSEAIFVADGGAEIAFKATRTPLRGRRFCL